MKPAYDLNECHNELTETSPLREGKVEVKWEVVEKIAKFMAINRDEKPYSISPTWCCGGGLWCFDFDEEGSPIISKQPGYGGVAQNRNHDFEWYKDRSSLVEDITKLEWYSFDGGSRLIAEAFSNDAWIISLEEGSDKEWFYQLFNACVNHKLT